MSALENLISAWTVAPPERRETVLRLLREEAPKPEPYLTLRGLAGKLGFGTTTLRRWQIPGHEIGGARRYRVQEVEAYFKTEEFNRRVAAVRSKRGQQRANAKEKVVT